MRGWLFNSTTEMLSHDIRFDFYKQVLNKDIPFFDKNRSGDLSKIQTLLPLIIFSQPHQHRCYQHSNGIDPKYIDDSPHSGHYYCRYCYHVLLKLVTNTDGSCRSNHIVFVQLLLYDETKRTFQKHLSLKGRDDRYRRGKLLKRAYRKSIFK